LCITDVNGSQPEPGARHGNNPEIPTRATRRRPTRAGEISGFFIFRGREVRGMGIYDDEEVAAFRMENGEIVCGNCLSEAEQKKLDEDSIITEKDIEEKFAFCDRCKKSLN
jgi:hypothetical protein